MAIPKFVQRAAKAIAGIPLAGPLIRKMVGGRFHLRYRFKHPFDETWGVDTSGRIEPEALTSNPQLAAQICRYTAIQPSVARRAFQAMPETEAYTLIDLGCGKGRATIIASECAFHRIIGVELSPQLARIARNNAAIIRAQYPQRTPIEIIEGDAVDFPVPARKIALFLYNPFGGELVGELVKNIERRLEKDIDHLFVVYHNPVYGDLFDQSPALTRWYAAHPVCEDSEKNFGPEREGATVIWQSVRNAYPAQHPRADRAILQTGFYETGLAE